MASLIEPWTEARLRGLDTHEHDFQEFKGSAWMFSHGEPASTFVYALSKQVSAFVNGAGGRLFLGLDDDGCVDGGVPKDLKGGGTRAWLEDIVPGCVDPPLRRCNVFEIGHGTVPDSNIEPGRAVYVIDLPGSEDAPHQAKDHRYYLRIAGKSRPMGHVHIQDVLRRTRHPEVTLSRLGPYGHPELSHADPRGPMVLVQFRAFLVNTGRTLARHVGLELRVPRPFVGREVRARTRRDGEVAYTQTPSTITYFRYHPTPMFPSQEVYAASVWISLHHTNVSLLQGGATLAWRVFADDAQPQVGHIELRSFAVVQAGLRALQEAGPGPAASGTDEP
jgi:hypothetical protein